MKDCQSAVSITQSVSDRRSSVQEMLAHLKKNGQCLNVGGDNIYGCSLTTRIGGRGDGGLRLRSK